MTPSRIGRYEVQRRLGAGGMGALYLARDPGLDRLVAIKLLKEDLQDDSGLRERFIREARSVARLRHANIVIVFDVGEDAGRPFMAMEYIAGETLAHVLRQKPSVPVTRRLAMVEDLCAGLAHAHGAGIIHRDIKPANMMIDGDGVLKILDFGIARLGNSGMTQEGMMMGTVNYMSPEQVTGRGVDHRTDIFAAGAVLYEAIALEQAFPGRIDTGVFHRILTEGPVPLNQLVRALDPELLGIVQKALERDPTQRYQDASVMRRDLMRVRRRLMDEGAGGLLDSTRATTIAEAKPTPSEGARRPDSDRPRRLAPERFVELQRQQVADHLRYGEEAFARGDHDAALQHAERAATVDPDSREAFDLIDRARFAIESKAVRQLLTQAQRLLNDGHIEDAAALADEASVTFPDVQGAAELRGEVRGIVERITAAREREQRIASSLERARASMERGGYETALRAVYEVLSIDPDRAEARALEQEAQQRLQAQREHERARRTAHDHLARARHLAGEGKYDDAIKIIESVASPSDTVRIAAEEALTFVRAAQRQAVVSAIVARAREAMDRGQFAEVLTAIDSIPAAEQTREVKSLRDTAERSLREQRDLERKRTALDSAIAAIQQLLERGELGPAQERLTAAWTIGLSDERLPALGSRIRHLVAEAEARRQQEVRDRLASQRVEAARQLLANGDGYSAVTLLERDGSGHPLVEAALKEIRAAIAEQEERVRQEAERRRQEEEAKRRAEIEAARKIDDDRKAEERRRREADRQRHREEVVTLLVDAERALAAQRPDEATVLLTRANERVESAEDTELRRRVAEMKADAERHARERLDEIQRQEAEARQREQQRLDEERAAEARRLEEEARRRDQALVDLLERAQTTSAHDAALTILDEAMTLAPGDPRVKQKVNERRAALAQQRLEEDRAREEARRTAEAEAARVREEKRRAAEAESARLREERRREEEARRREEEVRRLAEEARQREESLARMLAEARETEAHDVALTILGKAHTLAPGDSRIDTLIRQRNEALDTQRAAEAARVAEETARRAREREEELERERLEARRAEIARQHQREEQQRRQQEQRAARSAAIKGVVRDRRVHMAAAFLMTVAVGWAGWRFWPETETVPPPGQRPEEPKPKPPTEEPRPVPPAVTTAADAQAELQRTLQRARGFYTANRRQDAVIALRPVLTSDANNQDGRALLNTMIGDARKELAQAKSEAVSAQSEQLPSYQRGVTNETAGQRAIAANRQMDALPLLWSAREDFTAATQQGRMSAEARRADEERLRLERDRQARDEAARVAEKLKADEDARKAADARKLEDARRAEDARKAEEQRRADDALKAENASRVDPVAERAAIQQIINLYAAAYSRMDEDALRRIDPGFRGIPSRVVLKSVEMTPSAIAIDLDSAGQSARVRFTQNFRYVWNNRSFPPTQSGSVSWNMRKVGSEWTVTQ